MGIVAGWYGWYILGMAVDRKPRSIKISEAMWRDWQGQAAARRISITALIIERMRPDGAREMLMEDRRLPAGVAVLAQAVPICPACRWCRYPGTANPPCFHDQASKERIDCVSGDLVTPAIHCRVMRGPAGPCGVEGRLFEGRE